MTDREGYFRGLAEAAQDFCLLIEHVDIYRNEQWLADMFRILLRLQTTMTHLDDRDLECTYFSVPDLEERFELYCRLKDQLGECDAYMLEFDANDEEEEMTGSLAGDFADMYFELVRGLKLYQSGEENREDALTLWQSGYFLFWGRQLVNAQKHLYSLRVANQI